MRALASLALLLVLPAVPTMADARPGHGGDHAITAHRLHDIRMDHLRGSPFRAPRAVPFAGTGFFDYGDTALPFTEGVPPAPAIGSPPTLPPRRWGGRPSVEHTDVGVTIVRGPSVR